MEIGNIFADATAGDALERFEILLSHRNLVIERIVTSAAAPPSTYVQAQDEWVVLLRGEARLQLDGRSVQLGAGDHLFLPAGTPHTVERASDGAIWLAVHLYPEDTEPARGTDPAA